MTDRAALEALMNGPMQRTAHMTDMPCPRCDGMTVAASGSAHWCIASGCGWSALVRYARGEVDRRKE